MTTPQLRKFLLTVLIPAMLIGIAYNVYENHDWPVPEAAKQMKNPLQSSPAALDAAHAIYRDKCVNCHGQSGKGDGPDAASYYPSPTDFADRRQMATLTDGEIFYRITHGRRPMPSFRRKLTDEQRWQLVLLIRTFSAGTRAH
ncbi:MAG TPA: cytochrome c [Candidatus Methylomirabilis sp.]|nr:cytochrome c [Candidatus Methylomirabilis sp.]